MSATLQKYFLPILLLAWTLLNLLQAGLTELFHDEAYYWIYGKQLDWGYYDHPPLIGLLTRLGSSLLPGEIGLRLFPVLFNTATLWLIFKIVGPKDQRLLAAITLSMFILHAGGFLAAPDAPLIFSVALFLYAYKRYTQPEGKTLIPILLLILSITLMAYAKYQGALFLILILAARPGHLKDYRIWIIMLTVALLYLPHIKWQMDHDWVTFRFHLGERVGRPFYFALIPQFLLGQLISTGPLIAPLLWWAAWKHKPEDRYQKSLRFVTLVTLVLLLVLNLRGRVEGNWAAPAYIPLIILGYTYFENRPKGRKWLLRLAPVSIGLLLLFRLFLIIDLTGPLKLKTEFHGWKTFAKEVQQASEGTMPAFINSYQYAAKYWFYTGEPAITLNEFSYRGNQFDLLPLKQDMKGNPVTLFANYHHFWGFDTLETSNGYFLRYCHFPDYRNYNPIQITLREKEKAYPPNTKIQLPIRISNQSPEPWQFSTKTKEPVTLGYRMFKRIPAHYGENEILYLNDLRIDDHLDTTVTLTTPPDEGKYSLVFGLRTHRIFLHRNSYRITMKIEAKN